MLIIALSPLSGRFLAVLDRRTASSCQIGSVGAISTRDISKDLAGEITVSITLGPLTFRLPWMYHAKRQRPVMGAILSDVTQKRAKWSGFHCPVICSPKLAQWLRYSCKISKNAAPNRSAWRSPMIRSRPATSVARDFATLASSDAEHDIGLSDPCGPRERSDCAAIRRS